MTEVNRYRDGELSSTTLMQDAMERAHAVGQGEGKKLEWHKDHESMDQARARMHDEPATAMAYVAAAVLAVDVFKVGKDAAKNAPELLDAPRKFAKTEASNAAKFATTTVGATFASGAAGVLGVAAAVGEVVHAFGQGDTLAHRSDVDALDVAVTNLLELDPDFKSTEWKKHPGIAPNSTMALFEDSYGKLTDFGAKHVPELQAAADAGASAAIVAMKMGGPAVYFEQRPEMRQRFEDDIAFSKGFSNVLFIAARPGADEKLKTLELHMAERTVRNDASMAVRG